jgi:hypothetical protein
LTTPEKIHTFLLFRMCCSCMFTASTGGGFFCYTYALCLSSFFTVHSLIRSSSLNYISQLTRLAAKKFYKAIYITCSPSFICSFCTLSLPKRLISFVIWRQIVSDTCNEVHYCHCWGSSLNCQRTFRSSRHLLRHSQVDGRKKVPLGIESSKCSPRSSGCTPSVRWRETTGRGEYFGRKAERKWTVWAWFWFLCRWFLLLPRRVRIALFW